MKIVLLSLLLWLTFSFPAQTPASPATKDEPPYIYYYSEALNGVVIERADGTDSRIIGQGLVDGAVTWVRGPGWSADGRWFAWRVERGNYYTSAGKGAITSADGQTNLDMLTDFPCIKSMLWSPTDNIGLIYGALTRGGCPMSAWPIASYWLIDADSQSRLATFSIDSSSESTTAPLIDWQPDQQQIQFFEFTYLTGVGFQYYLIKMAFDGTVLQMPVTKDLFRAGLSNTSHMNVLEQDRKSLFLPWYKAMAGKPISPPPNSSAAPGVASGQWDTSGTWLLVGYEWCFADCANVTGRVNIYNPATGYSREISACGAHPACVGWLPEQVELSMLPPGQPTSVLPTPESMDYNATFWKESGENDYGFFSSPEITTHELMCERGKLSQVRNKSTGEIEFVIPNAGSCPYVQLGEEIIYTPRPVIFALSPDKRYYAITDSTEYTALYDAKTGSRIARMNFYGIRLSFSAESRSLITMGRYATATWDIQTLVAQSLSTGHIP